MDYDNCINNNCDYCFYNTNNIDSNSDDYMMVIIVIVIILVTLVK